MPSTLEQYAGPFGGGAQVPIFCPSAITQLAVQHSPSPAHTSPGCTQNDEPSLQCFVASQSPEQQSPLPSQALPAVLQRSFNAVHLPSAPHNPPQHSALLAQASPSEVHAVSEHAPSTQLSEQHSVATLHALLAFVQVFGAATHPVCESQTPEQQSAPLVHASETAWQSPPGLFVPPGSLSTGPLPDRPLPIWPALPAAEELEPAVSVKGVFVEPPQPTQKAVMATTKAPTMRRGRVIVRIIWLTPGRLR